MSHGHPTFVSSTLSSALSPTIASCLPSSSSPTRTFRVSSPNPYRLSIPLPLAPNVFNPSPIGSTIPPARAILWLRLGCFRLADNPAVSAALSTSNALLPIATIPSAKLSPIVISAVLALREQLLSLGSTLIIRVVPDAFLHEVHVVRQIADQLGVRSVFVNLPKRQMSGLSILRQQGISVSSFYSHADNLSAGHFTLDWSILSNEPKHMPALPRGAREIPSDSLSFIGSVHGERMARDRLSVLLRTQNEPLLNIMWLLQLEIETGCLARERVTFEFNRLCLSPSLHGRLPKRLTFAQRVGSFFSNSNSTPAMAALSIVPYDVNGGDRRGVEWDDSTKKFILKEWEHAETERRMKPRERLQEFARRRRNFLMRSFFPEDVTPDYYSFTAWRFAQRCVSSTIGVFGTSSLLFALGIRSGRIGQAAVISWVLKEGFGRVGKMIWAGSMGKDFDVDPKRWRFRSAVLYAAGNGLEIVTQIFPASFLIFATAANSMKQVSMLTSSACRNAMYRSFGERSQNIANITAKGEAQIVVADLFGMGCGIRLSKLMSSSRSNVVGAFFALTVLDIFGIYMELRSVVFRSLNAERSSIVISRLMDKGDYLTPSQVSPKERICLRPRYMRFVRMSSIAKAAKDPAELEMLLRVFRKEHFMVSTPRSKGGGPCRLVLRNDASNEDVLRAMFLIGHVQKAMKTYHKKSISLDEKENILRCAAKMSKRAFPSFMASIREAGWSTENLLFSTMKRRGYWRREAA